MRSKAILFFFLLIFFSKQSILAQSETFTAEEKPWLWWYWMGSAVTPHGLDQHIEAFYNEGIGGVNIAATYGVDGNENHSIRFMSEKWVNMISYTANISGKRKMAVDVSLASAWPFGGPNVTPAMAAQHIEGGKLLEATGGEHISTKLTGTALMKLVAVEAYSDKGKYLDITSRVSQNGYLQFIFPKGKWDVYTLFSVPTGQMVKRSGPGGQGLVLDHFNKSSVEKYLGRFDSLFTRGKFIRSVFNDSYEVYGADFSSGFLEEFLKRRGYDLRKHLDIFFSTHNTPDRWRILCDYRETISDLLLNNFVIPWTDWAHRHRVKTVEQAHGSPANWLDLYAASDIPQTESFGSSNFQIPFVRVDKDYASEVFGRPDKLLLKFSSSAANITGKKLVSSETATWLGNHFKVALSQVKPQIDELFIAGINHVMLACAAYSPFELGFPGWMFYPASNFGHNSGLFDYMPDLSKYISRSQKILQNTLPDNEVLLYFPIHDIWSEFQEDGRSKLAMMAIHNPLEWFYKNDFGNVARRLRDEGFDFDYVSDLQLQLATAKDKQLVSSAGKKYKAIVVPSCKRMPLQTLEAINKLAAQGVSIVFAYKMPYDVPGYYKVEASKKQLTILLKELKSFSNVFVTDQFTTRLQEVGCKKEEFGELQLEYIRKKSDSGFVYFIANQHDQFREGWIKLPGNFTVAQSYDPLSGQSGILKRKDNEIYLQLLSGQSCFIKVYNKEKSDRPWSYFSENMSWVIDGPWNITFEKGAPSIPAPATMPVLQSWTTLQDTMARYFSGTASYETTFDVPADMANSKNFRIDLGDVREMAEVYINDRLIGRTWSVPFELDVPSGILKPAGNKLTVKVTNLDANRMIWMDKNNIKWQNYFFVDISYGRFNTSHWHPVESGLMGKIRLESSTE